jgi:hypothetical protein
VNFSLGKVHVEKRRHFMQASQHVFPSQHGCGDVKGQILLDPVDGFDPFGWFPNFITTPGEYLNYAMPTLGTTTDFFMVWWLHGTFLIY